jgi:hypothetical protein
MLLLGSTAFAHVVSMSSGELHVEGRMATYELRIPMYEVAHVSNPDTALLEHVRFAGARRTSSACMEQEGTYICRASYEFENPVPDKIEAECTLFEVPTAIRKFSTRAFARWRCAFIRRRAPR